jgi:hypothetical protein
MLAVLALAAPAAAQTASAARFATTTLDVSGHGEARLPPDMATIVLGVEAEGAGAAAAMQANAAAMTRVIAALRADGVAPTDMQTSTLSLSPRYADVSGAPPKLTGYAADNRVTVRVADLTRLGPVMDAVVGAGANSVSQISFGLKSRASAENYARLAAVKDLDDKAALFAEAAGYHIRRLVTLSEGSAPSTIAPRMMRAADVAGAATPVEAGMITVSVDVSGEFELTH